MEVIEYNWRRPPKSGSNPLFLCSSNVTLSASVHNREGRLPLHLLLIHNEDYSAFQHSFDSGRNTGIKMESLPDVKAMIEANPRALDSIEPVSGLHPFMLAAVNNTIPLDIVCLLLSRNPVVLNGFMRA